MVFADGGAAGGGNFGGGIQYWPKDRIGLRFEVRDHIFSSDSPHIFTFLSDRELTPAALAAIAQRCGRSIPLIVAKKAGGKS